MDEFNNIPENNAQDVPPVDPQPTVQPAYEAAPVVEPTVQPAAEPEKKSFDGLGLASMICAIASVLICSCYGIGIIPAIVGLILGCVAKKNPVTGKKSAFALVGIIVSSISIGLNLICMIMSFAGLFAGLVDVMSDYNSASDFYSDFYSYYA